MEILLENIGVSDITSVNVTITASDGYNKTFSYDEIVGNIDIYDTYGNATEGNVTMILAYAENGKYDFEDGPLRIAYIDDGLITPSSLWIREVVSIKILPL